MRRIAQIYFIKNLPVSIKQLVTFLCLIILLVGCTKTKKNADTTIKAEAVVLVNSANGGYDNFKQYIQPYLENFGIPYTIIDIAVSAVGEEIKEYAVIIVGHRQFDTEHKYLGKTEQQNISAAVKQGTGLVNFDNDLSTEENIGRYQFVDDVFGFRYAMSTTGAGVRFVEQGKHYINERHDPAESIITGQMTLAGIESGTGVNAIAMTGDKIFLAVTTSGKGCAVQWATYDWMSHSVKGPVFGLDDLLWRSIVWAARKPFVMQVLPPFVTMRVDDVAGPLWWIEISNEFGLKPWVGIFLDNIDSAESIHLASLVDANKATASVHAFSATKKYGRWCFYYDHAARKEWPDWKIAAHYAEATEWHHHYNIPISRFMLPHYYEIGTNVFAGLADWGIEFVGIPIEPGNNVGSALIMNGPYRCYETGLKRRRPIYYADFLTVSGHPEFDDKFFNCATEIRDDAGYEWYPDNDVPGSIGRGTRQTKRALDSIVLATLFTHEHLIQKIKPENWHLILKGITSNIKGYNPIYVTLDYGCRYVRAKHTSRIESSVYEPSHKKLTTIIGGKADMPTMFYIFTKRDGLVRELLVEVPAFVQSLQIIHLLPTDS